jgi:hypothetical protein
MAVTLLRCGVPARARHERASHDVSASHVRSSDQRVAGVCPNSARQGALEQHRSLTPAQIVIVFPRSERNPEPCRTSPSQSRYRVDPRGPLIFAAGRTIRAPKMRDNRLHGRNRAASRETRVASARAGQVRARARQSHWAVSLTRAFVGPRKAGLATHPLAVPAALAQGPLWTAVSPGETASRQDR